MNETTPENEDLMEDAGAEIMPAPEAAPSLEPEPEPAPAPTDLEISIDVHVASMELPVADVRNWLAGGVVSLPGLDMQDGLVVELRNGKRVIATGTLVRLDDCYGIMIDQVRLPAKRDLA
jgi:flagellar motor switch/type III secretory pathway protein FliN